MNPIFILLIFFVVALIWSFGSFLVVRNIEKPRYIVVDKRNGYEIRDYTPYIVAEVEVIGRRNNSMNQ